MHLVNVAISKNTLGCAESLAGDVKDGVAIGAVIGILYKQRRYSVVICGEAFRDPTWADGITSVVKAELMDLIREQGQRHTTL